MTMKPPFARPATSLKLELIRSPPVSTLKPVNQT
jgi:hypothetical protein